ncbi:MAG: hypothetical protein P0S96_04435 [Simkaniaceae bacterium]|nr:hypothetical protein [Candidatus Sacchlamyda saccharinae]
MALAATSGAEISLAADWSCVDVIKHNEFGKVVTSFGKPVRFQYHKENSTGDLYGIQDSKKGLDTAKVISAKALIILCAAPIYTVGMMTVALVRIALNVSSIFWRILPQFVRNAFIKGPVQALADLTMRVGFDLPLEVIKDLWRIVRSPLYGFGIMLAGLVAIPCPFEGRKWLGRIEGDWHEGLSCNRDIRYGKTPKEIDNLPFSELIWEIQAGKVFLLGYCMYQRGNINDRIAGKPRFEQYIQESKPEQPKGWTWFRAKTP